MSISPFDSAIYRELLGDEEIGQLFTDTAEIVAWQHVEGALARAQGELGLIPKKSAVAIAKACGKTRIDPAGLAAGTGRDGIPVPALIAALRQAMANDEHSGYLHFGATSQDILDTGLVLRLRAVCAIVEARRGRGGLGRAAARRARGAKRLAPALAASQPARRCR